MEFADQQAREIKYLGVVTNACGRDLQEDDHGEEHVKTRQAGVVPTTAAVGHQVGGHARQRLQK